MYFMLTLRWVRLEGWISFLFRYIETNHPKEVNHSGVCVVLIQTLFANTGRWTVCSWALFYFLLSLFSETSISEAGRLQEGDGTVILRGFNIFFVYSCGLFDCDLFQICTAPKMRWHTVSLFHCHTRDCFASLWVFLVACESVWHMSD